MSTDTDITLLTGMTGNEQSQVVFKPRGSLGVMVASYSHSTQAKHKFLIIVMI